jgi:hypothetical protein
MPRVFRRGAAPLEKWRQQTEAAVSVVERLAETPATSTLHGAAWSTGMLRYYAKQALQLASHPPKGGESDSKRFRSRLTKVVSSLQP